MADIHPSSIIDSRAQLADDVTIGPGCTIQGQVTIASGTRLVGRVWLQGPLRIGQNNVIYPNACIGLEPQDRKFDPSNEGCGTQIGSDNIIREGVTIHRATKDRPTTIGDGNFLMVNSHLAHDVLIDNRVTLVNGALLAGHVHVQDQAIISGNCAVHQFCRIGRMAIMSGVQGVTQDVPPFCMVYQDRTISCLNLVGLRRNGLRDHIKYLEHAFDILFLRELPNAVAAQRILDEYGHDPLCREMAQFVQASQRGICSYGGHMQATEIFE